MKKNITISIDIEVIEKAKDAVYWTPQASLSDFFQQGILTYIKLLEEQHGKTFETRQGNLKHGRSIR